MMSIKVNWNNGDYLYTKINGTKDEVRRYYFNNIFHKWYEHLGKEMSLTCTSIEFFDVLEAE
jgi:hypothetical protein